MITSRLWKTWKRGESLFSARALHFPTNHFRGVADHASGNLKAAFFTSYFIWNMSINLELEPNWNPEIESRRVIGLLYVGSNGQTAGFLFDPFTRGWKKNYLIREKQMLWQMRMTDKCHCRIAFSVDTETTILNILSKIATISVYWW